MECFFYIKNHKLVNIWMHNTFIPLDIIFIDKNKKVSSIKEGKPLSRKIISSDKKVIAVLELPQNCSKKISLNVGDTLEWIYLEFSKKKTYHCLSYDKD